jgi:hypothetical protein
MFEQVIVDFEDDINNDCTHRVKYLDKKTK